MAEHKRTIRLSDDSRGGWERIAQESGATITAVVEALGELAARVGSKAISEEVLDRARQIALERSRRR